MKQIIDKEILFLLTGPEYQPQHCIFGIFLLDMVNFIRLTISKQYHIYLMSHI